MTGPPGIEELYREQRRGLLRYLVRRTGDTQVALDLWAETFAVAFTSRASFRGQSRGEAVAWLYGIARHQLAHYHRDGAAQKRALHRLGLERPPAEPDLVADIERDAELEELRRQVSAALDSLSHRNRAAVELRVLEGLAYADVATRLGITEPTARARVSRSLTAMANAMDSDLSEVRAG